MRILRYYFVPPASSGWAYERIVCGRARVSVSVFGSVCVRVSGSLYARLCMCDGFLVICALVSVFASGHVRISGYMNASWYVYGVYVSVFVYMCICVYLCTCVKVDACA